MGRTFLLALLLALVLGWFFLRWFQRTPPAQVRARLQRSALLLLAVMFVALAVSGRLHWLFGILGGMLPVARRAWLALRAVQRLKGAGTASAAGARRASQIETPWLRMALDHASGQLDGQVLQGPHQGRHLGDLALAEVITLWRQLRSVHPESARLLEAWLDREHGGAWRDADDDGAADAAGAADTTSREITEAEAWAMLGLAPGATRADIRRAYKRLMQKLHPDRGGNAWLAARLNQAKTLLMKKIEETKR